MLVLTWLGEGISITLKMLPEGRVPSGKMFVVTPTCRAPPPTYWWSIAERPTLVTITSGVGADRTS